MMALLFNSTIQLLSLLKYNTLFLNLTFLGYLILQLQDEVGDM